MNLLEMVNKQELKELLSDAVCEGILKAAKELKHSERTEAQDRQELLLTEILNTLGMISAGRY